jgi:hypothetical protein
MENHVPLPFFVHFVLFLLYNRGIGGICQNMGAEKIYFLRLFKGLVSLTPSTFSKKLYMV